MTAGRSIARAGLIVSSAYLVSRFLGWLRLVVIGNTFGASAELDTFFAAFRIPDLIYMLVAAGALGSALIPILSSLFATDGHDRAWRIVSTVANLMLSALVVLAVVLFVAAPAVMLAITPGFDPAQIARTVELTRIMLLGPIFLALGAVATSILNAGGRFAAAAAAPSVYNLAIIGAALFLAPSMGVHALAVGVVLGSAAHVAVQLAPLLRLGFRYVPRIDLGDDIARQALGLMAPRAIGLGAGQVTFVVMTSLASTLGAGAITAWNIAFTLMQVPIGLIGVPLGTVVFPSLSREAAIGREDEYASLLTRALRLLLYTMLPIAGLFAILRRPIVEVLFPAFDAAAVDLTADTLLYFLTGIAAHALIAVLARAFYARQDTRTPVAAAVMAVVINTSLAFLLVRPFELAGIAASIAIAAWLEALVLLAILHRRLPAFRVRDLGRVAIEAAVGTGLAVAAGLATFATLDGALGPDPGRLVLVAEGLVVGAAFGLVYLVLSLALRIPELPTIVGVVTELLRRRGRS